MRPVLSHPGFAELHPTGEHPERQERLRVLLDAFPGYEEPRPATPEELAACHDPGYIEAVRATAESGRTVLLDPDTVCTPSSYEAALLAAGAAIAAVEREGFALARPPGHHALPDRAMGFCLFDNVAVAARFAQRELGLARIAILDWDVHHGNGTQDIFWDDDSVLFVSLHQWPFYPGTGGPGEGNETTINVPLRAGSGDAEYAEAAERIAFPALEAFAPDLLLVSAGFDAAAGDPLGGMELTEDGFHELARRAGSVCGRLALVLEGGYNISTLPGLVRSVLEAVQGTVMDATTETFESEVLERSEAVPVVVDFWADWCEPCKTLTPVLEEAVAERDGQVALVKIDIDANPDLAERFGVRGIPNVKAFRRGAVVDEFVGAVSAQAVASFLDGLTGPSPAERLLAELSESGEFQAILGPLAEGDYERALEWLLAELPAADAERRERIREVMVSLFDELGHDHPLATHYRRRLATALY